MYETSQIPSFFDSDPKLLPTISETPIKTSYNSMDYDKKFQEDSLYNQAFYDEMTEKQYEECEKALKKVAASLPSMIKFKGFLSGFRYLAEDHWELVRKKIQKPKKMKVTRSSIKCKICGLGLRTRKFY